MFVNYLFIFTNIFFTNEESPCNLKDGIVVFF